MLRLWSLDQALGPEALARVIHFDRFDANIAAGGDGTVRALAKAMGADAPIPIGIIPAGTGNVLARDLPLPTGPAAIADMLLNGPEILIGGAQAAGQPFFLMAGVGFDGEIIAALNLAMKRRIGKAAYVWPILKALSRPLGSFDITVDGIAHRASWAIATKSGCYAGGFVLAKGLTVRDGRLVAVLFQATSRRQRLLEMIALGAGLVHRLPGVLIVPCRELSVSGSGHHIQIDGDAAGTTPARIALGAESLRIIAPATLPT